MKSYDNNYVFVNNELYVHEIKKGYISLFISSCCCIIGVRDDLCT